MYRAKVESEENEKQFRCRCAREKNDLAILMSNRIYKHTDVYDLQTILDYGWDGDQLERILNGKTPADHITRLAAWIRECGDIEDPYDTYLKYEREPPLDYILDEDGNYPEEIEEVF